MGVAKCRRHPLSVSVSAAVSQAQHYADLQTRLADYVSRQDARVGVAVIVDGKDTIDVNGRRDFPMLSVYKFPQAIAVADYCRRLGIQIGDSLAISAEEMHANTYSPMYAKYGKNSLRLSVSELLAYSLQQSDNNACDILFRLIGGPAKVASLMKSMGYGEVIVANTENEMHRNPYLCYQNRSTPLAMAGLLEQFNTVLRADCPQMQEVAALMENCSTGVDRLAAPLTDTGVVIGHKTGTADRNSQGRLVAINDVGYVNLPDGRHYSIAVFVADSAYDMASTASIIATVSRMVYKAITAEISEHR